MISTSSVLSVRCTSTLVDDDLEEQRRDQREDLQEERGNQHLAEQASVFVNGTEEPGDVEPARQIDEAGPPGHQKHLAVPRLLEFGARHHGGPRRERRLDQGLVVTDYTEQQKVAVA
jgi:hypothetical protein